jgi:hypothetical protein
MVRGGDGTTFHPKAGFLSEIKNYIDLRSIRGLNLKPTHKKTMVVDLPIE